MEAQMQTLTVYHYGESSVEDRRITVSPNLVTAVAAGAEDVAVNGRQLRAVTLLFVDGGSLDLFVNHSDMTMLEEAIGSYCFG